MNQIVIVLGDGAIASVVESDLPRVALDGDCQWLFASSERGTIERLNELVRDLPTSVSVAELTFPEAATLQGWDDPAAMPAGVAPFRHPDRSLYQNGNSQGAQSRADAAFRVINSTPLVEAIDEALRRVLQPNARADFLDVHVTVVASLYRNTGSGGLVPLLGLLDSALHRARSGANFQVNVICASPSLLLTGNSRAQAIDSRATALAEIDVAEVELLEVVPGSYLGAHLRHVVECGAPAGRNGFLPDERAARRAFALAVEAWLRGPIADAIRATIPITSAIVTNRRHDSGERTRFSGIGAVEVRLEPDAARQHLVATIMARLPSLSPQT